MSRIHSSEAAGNLGDTGSWGRGGTRAPASKTVNEGQVVKGSNAVLRGLGHFSAEDGYREGLNKEVLYKCKSDD